MSNKLEKRGFGERTLERAKLVRSRATTAVEVVTNKVANREDPTKPRPFWEISKTVRGRKIHL